MNDKPVYQVSALGNPFEECSKEFYDLQLQNEYDWIQTRILYPASAYEALKAENEELRHINLTSLADLHFKNRELESKNEALRKIKQAAENLVNCKGRYHTEQNMIALTNVLAASKNGDSK